MDFTGVGVYANPPIGGWNHQFMLLSHLVNTSMDGMSVFLLLSKEVTRKHGQFNCRF